MRIEIMLVSRAVTRVVAKPVVIAMLMVLVSNICVKFLLFPLILFCTLAAAQNAVHYNRPLFTDMMIFPAEPHHLRIHNVRSRALITFNRITIIFTPSTSHSQLWLSRWYLLHKVNLFALFSVAYLGGLLITELKYTGAQIP